MADIDIPVDSEFLGGYVTSDKLFVGKRWEIDQNGLLSEKIFGPTKNYRCTCGKLSNKLLDKGKTCPKCHVVCGDSTLRLHVFGKIKMIFPVIKPTKKNTFVKDILTSKYKLIINPIYNDLISNSNFFLSINKNNTQIKIVDEFIESNGFIPIPLKITGIFSFILALQFAATYLKNQKATELFTKNYFITDLKVLPPDVRPIIVDYTKANEVRVTEINKHYCSLIRLNKSNAVYEESLNHDVAEWSKQIKDYFLLHDGKTFLSDYSIQEYDNIASRYQYYVDRVYDCVFGILSAKEGLIRNSVLGKTIDFSARSVITSNPSLPIYQVKVSKKILYKLWHPYFLYYLTAIKGYDYDTCFEEFASKEDSYKDHIFEFNEFLDWMCYSDDDGYEESEKNKNNFIFKE